VAWRLRAARADLHRVFDLTEGFSLPASLGSLRDAVAAIGDVRLVVIDPLTAVSSVHLSSGAVKIRAQITNPLEAFASDTGVALLIVHHFTKDGKTVGGSKTITDAARVVLQVKRSATRDTVRELSVLKSNVGSDSSVVPYVIAGTSDRDVHVEWLLDDDTAERETSRRETPEDRVLGVLRDAGEPMTGQEVAGRLRMSYGDVRVALHRLSASGHVVSPERGTYASQGTARLRQVAG
jgi:hypothetical protein